MSTALTTPGTGLFSGLSRDSRQRLVFKANTGGKPFRESDFTKVKTPAGGGLTWEIDNQGNVETAQEIVGVIVAIGVKGLLWPFDEIGSDAPVVVSPDLVTGYRTSEKLGNIDPAVLEKYRIGDRRYDWAAMSTGPDFGPKTGRAGVGKRVKESKTIAVLRPGDLMPILISVGPGSLARFDSFMIKLRDYHYETVVGLKLQKAQSRTNITYSEIVPRYVETLTPEQGEVLLEDYTIPISTMFKAPPAAHVGADTIDGEVES